MRRRVALVLALPVAAAALGALASCGARTGLLSPDEEQAVDGAAPFDGSRFRDATRFVDVYESPEADTGLDVIPPIDVIVPTDAFRSQCVDAAATLIYVITEQYDLYSFDPSSLAFTNIGAIACPSAPGATPFSMAVDERGIAYIVFNDGNLYRVSTATAACEATAFTPGQNGFTTFGMGFSADTTDTGETLFVASDGNSELGSIDVTSFTLTPVGGFNPVINMAELTGTGAGQLFGFYSTDPGDSAIAQIDKATAAVTNVTPLPGVAQGSGWAFAFYGGDFYLFTAPSAPGSTVTRFRPSDNSITVLTTLPETIVGAGVSTCAPAQ